MLVPTRQPDKSHTSSSAPTWNGTTLGIGVGCLLSGVWTVIVSAAIVVWGINHDMALGSSIDWEKAMGTIVVIMVMGLYIGVVLGILPGTVIGAVAGTIIGWLVRIMQKRISPKTAPVLGILVSIPMILAIHLLTWRAIVAGNLDLENLLPQDLLYLLTLGVPSILFAFASALVSYKLHKQLLFHE